MKKTYSKVFTAILNLSCQVWLFLSEITVIDSTVAER